MLIEFSVDNYKVFSSRQTLSMLAKKSYKEHARTTVVPELFDDLLINKAAIIYGANGSGKSSFVEAIDFLQSYVLFGYANKNSGAFGKEKFIERDIPSFIFDDSKFKSPTSFDISFLAESGERYQYSLSIGKQHVSTEGLWVYSKKGVRAKTIISRAYNEEEKKFDYYCPSLEIDKKTYEVAIDKAHNSPRSPFVSVLDAYDVSQLSPFIKWFARNLTVSSNQHDNMFRLASKSTLIEEVLNGGEDRKEKIITFLRMFDLSITDFTVKKRDVELPEDLPEEMRRILLSDVGYQITVEHTTSDGTKKNLSYDQLSSGTKKLFDLSGFLIHYFESEQSVMVLDEFETSLHPYLVRLIYQIIVMNPNSKLQLILTTHSNVLLDTDKLVRRDQIWFIEKNSDLESELYPLTDFAPKKEDSILKGWDLGNFGGVPFLETFK